MKLRFTLFRRGEVFYCQDTTTGKQTSLRTADKAEAHTLLSAKNEAHRQPRLNLEIARTYLTAGDPTLNTRAWSAVMDQMQTHGKPATQARCARAMRSSFLDAIRNKPLVQTTSADLLAFSQIMNHRIIDH